MQDRSPAWNFWAFARRPVYSNSRRCQVAKVANSPHSCNRKCTLATTLEMAERCSAHWNEFPLRNWKDLYHWVIQLGSSSCAKHGGAYLSAVFGRKFNPTTVLRPCQPLACYWGVGIAAAPTLFTTSAKHHGSRWCGWSDLSLLFTRICDTEQILVNKSDKSDHPHQREPWCFVEVVNKVGVEAMPTNF